VRRARANAPLQALTTLNETLFIEAALALKTLREGGAIDAQRMIYAFRQCLACKLTAPESGELLKHLRKGPLRARSPNARVISHARMGRWNWV